MNYKNDYLFYFKILKNKFKSNNNICTCIIIFTTYIDTFKKL